MQTSTYPINSKKRKISELSQSLDDTSIDLIEEPERVDDGSRDETTTTHERMMVKKNFCMEELIQSKYTRKDLKNA